MRYDTDYIIKKMQQLEEEMRKVPEENDHGWAWENLLAILSQAKEQARGKQVLSQHKENG